ncbi:MAG: glycosyl transferase, partial [Hyphomicrobiales bacterium]|nr:glycosyl transferase [Hyphomicrobiales bacterium]
IGAFGILSRQDTVIALSLCGAMAGFAWFNRPVARLFLGDVGSLPIGLLLGWLLLRLAADGHLAAALLLPLYYLADATLTLLRRLIRGEPVWHAHRTHFYQLATDRGFTVAGVVASVFAVNVALCALALLIVIWPSRNVEFAALAGGIVLVGCELFAFARGRR